MACRMSACGRLRCKSLFASLSTNFPSSRRSDRIIMRGTTSTGDELAGNFGGALEDTSIGGSERLRRGSLPDRLMTGVDMIVRWFGLLATIVLLNPCQATAQGLVGAATQAKDLTFPTVPSTVSANDPRMTLLKPNGSGPFPAIVLHHQCAGLRTKGGPNRSMATWAATHFRVSRKNLGGRALTSAGR